MSLMAAKNTRSDGYDLSKAMRAKFATEAALDHVVASLRARDDLPFKGGRVNSQAVVNASWLLLESFDAEVLANLIRPHLARLEAMLAGKPDPGYRVSPEFAQSLGGSHEKPDRSNPRADSDGIPRRVIRKRRS